MFVASCDPILAQKWTSLVYLYNQDAYEMHVKHHFVHYLKALKFNLRHKELELRGMPQVDKLLLLWNSKFTYDIS
jgi:hypothetical protein